MNIGIFKIPAIMSCLAIMLATSAKADLLTVDRIIFQNVLGVNPLLLSGTLEATVSGNQLTLVLRNTSPDDAFTSGIPKAAMLLSGFGLQLPSTVDVLGGTVSISDSNSAPVNFSSALDLSTQWNFANQSTNGFSSLLPGFVNTTFSSVNNGQANPFSGSANLNGPNFGALSALETQFLPGNQEAVRDSIRFVLTLNGPVSIADIQAGNVVLAFGSPDAVPDGGSTLALLGVALIGVEFLRRKISKNRLTLN